MRGTNQRLSKYMAMIVCLTPFLIVYDSSVITYIQLLFFSVYIFIRLKNKELTVTRNPLVMYWIYAVVLSIFMGIQLNIDSTTINRTFSVALYVLFLIYAKDDVNMEQIKKIYKYVSLFCVFFFVFQFMCFYMLHRGIMFQIPFLKLRTDLETAYKYLSLAEAYGSSYVRFPGPFSEPSVYAEYVTPLIAFYLFGCEGVCRRNFIKAGLIALTVLLSTSGIGIVMVGACFVVYALIYSKNKLVVVLSIISVLIVAVLTYEYVPGIRLTVDNLFVTGNINSVNSKADYRIYRGIAYFGGLPIIYKLFGVGLYNAEVMAKHIGLNNLYDRAGQGYEYFNGFSQMFIYTGIIGTTLIWLYFIFNVKYMGSNLRRAIFILYVGLIIGSSTLFDGIGLIYLTLILMMN